MPPYGAMIGPREPDVPHAPDVPPAAMMPPDVTPVRWMLYTVMDDSAENILRRSTGGIVIYVRDICEVHSPLADSGYPASPLESVWMVQTTDGFHSLINFTTCKWVPFEEIHSVEVRRVVREIVVTDPLTPSRLRM